MFDLEETGRRAKGVCHELQLLSAQEKNAALTAVAGALCDAADSILYENEKDLAAGRKKGMPAGLTDRLFLDEGRIRAMADGVREVAALPDPVGEEIERFVRPNGLVIRKVRVPLGVIGIIYESRPNVTADAFSLCFKSGNATVLKGGSDAIFSNTAIANVIRKTLAENGVSGDACQLITDTDRAVTTAFMKLNRYIDVLIPRGSESLIRSTVENATVPVIETGTGNCHVFVDETADMEMALRIIVNAKTQRTGVCNAAESLVVHEKASPAFLPLFEREMEAHHVEIRADEAARRYLNGKDVKNATEDDFSREYLDAVISVKTVSSFEEAIAHINRCNTGHSDAIVTRDQDHAARFLREIDAACVYVNASTRFTDGFEFGFGAEIGISTQKLHARGPMGLREMTSYKYLVEGTGQVRG